MRKKMYIVINKDLKMSEGKVNAHVAHAILDYFNNYINKAYEEAGYIDEWVESGILNDIAEELKELKDNGDTIIILEAPESVMKKLHEKGYTTVIDAGYNEVESGSITAVNIGIFTDEDKPKEIKRCRLYRRRTYKSYLIITGYKIMVNFIIDSNTDPNKILEYYKSKYTHADKLIYLGELDELKSSIREGYDNNYKIYNDIFYEVNLEDGTKFYSVVYC